MTAAPNEKNLDLYMQQILDRFKVITKLEVKSVDETLSQEGTPKKLVSFRGGKNQLFKDKPSELHAAYLNFGNFLQSAESGGDRKW